jgi:hypothetical protein
VAHGGEVTGVGRRVLMSWAPAPCSFYTQTRCPNNAHHSCVFLVLPPLSCPQADVSVTCVSVLVFPSAC